MKKIIITIIISILSIGSIGGFKIANNVIKKNSQNNSSINQNENTINTELIDEEFIGSFENKEIENSINEEKKSPEPENTNSENDEIIVSEKKETTTSNSASSGKSNTSSNQSVNTEKTTIASTNKATSNSNSKKSNTDTSKSSNSQTTSSTPSSPQTTVPTETEKTPVYCFEGGSKHLGGDGPYEHGYYNTWQQAWDALTVYMEDMSSGNYEVQQCLGCDKYYFYCKQD